MSKLELVLDQIKQKNYCWSLQWKQTLYFLIISKNKASLVDRQKMYQSADIKEFTDFYEKKPQRSYKKATIDSFQKNTDKIQYDLLPDNSTIPKWMSLKVSNITFLSDLLYANTYLFKQLRYKKKQGIQQDKENYKVTLKINPTKINQSNQRKTNFFKK